MAYKRTRTKLFHAVIAAILAAFVFIFLYFYIGVNQKKYTYEDSKTIAMEVSRRTAKQIEEYFIFAWRTARSLANQSIIYQKQGAGRDRIVELMRGSIEKNPNFLSVWTMWEPNFYDGKDSYFKNKEYNDSKGHLSVTFFRINDSILTEYTIPEHYQEDFYTIPKSTKKELILEPYFYQYEGHPYLFYETTVVIPILIDTLFAGVVAIDLDLNYLQKTISQIKLYDNGYISLISANGEIVTHRDKEFISKNLFELFGREDTLTPSIIRNAREFSIETHSAFLGERVLRFFHPIMVGDNWQWSIMVEIPKEKATTRSKQLEYIALGTLITGLILLSYLVVNILERHSYEKELVLAKERALKNEEILKKMYADLHVSAQETQAANEELNATTDALIENNRLLLEAKKKAEESDNLKMAFLQNMNHEIRTPLNAIQGFAALAGKPGLSDEKRQNYISIIQNSSNQLLTIVNDILTISSIDTGQEIISLSKVCINRLVIETEAIFNQVVMDKPLNIKAIKGLADIDSEIETDKTKLNQIITNLLANAIKYTPAGEIVFGYTLKEPFLEFFVKDNGIGIEESKQDIIFERFAQANDSIRYEYGGTGLGLSICKGYVELMGGKIWVESEPGKGATFFFTIPYNPTTKESGIVPKNHISKRQPENFTILIVEDDPLSYRLLTEILKMNSYNIIQARNGQEAVDACHENDSVGLVLMDIKMPVMDGIQATKLIKEFRPKLPIIAQSAFATEQEINRSNHLFAAYITKPIHAEILLNLIHEYHGNNS
jgi:signal transduction histidine kinase/CheY-like chemotaxis protein